MDIVTPDNSTPKRKQNLICIFEKSKDHHIHNKIVTFFMNRLTIEENAAFECVGICTIDNKNLEDLPDVRHKNDWENILPIIAKDIRKIKNLISESANYESQECDTHTLFGTSFYTSPKDL